MMRIWNDFNENPTYPQMTLAVEITPGIIIDIDKNIYSDMNSLLKLKIYH